MTRHGSAFPGALEGPLTRKRDHSTHEPAIGRHLDPRACRDERADRTIGVYERRDASCVATVRMNTMTAIQPKALRVYRVTERGSG